MAKCKQCGSETSNPKFCSQSCAATFNNKKRKKSTATICPVCRGNKKKASKQCIKCFKKARLSKSKKVADCKHCGKKLSYSGTECRTCISKIRRYKNKKRAVEHKGGKCERCGFDSHLCALEFHHVDGKEQAIGRMLNQRWESIEKELDKCVLLCSNCHRIEHCKYDETSDMIGTRARVVQGKCWNFF